MFIDRLELEDNYMVEGYYTFKDRFEDLSVAGQMCTLLLNFIELTVAFPFLVLWLYVKTTITALTYRKGLRLKAFKFLHTRLLPNNIALMFLCVLDIITGFNCGWISSKAKKFAEHNYENRKALISLDWIN